MTGPCEFWVNLAECLGDREAEAIYCGKPDRYHRTLADGTKQYLCLRHRAYLLRIGFFITIEDWIQANIHPRFAEKVLDFCFERTEPPPPTIRISPAQVSEIVWRHSQCANRYCSMVLFSRELAEKLNEFFRPENED